MWALSPQTWLDLPPRQARLAHHLHGGAASRSHRAKPIGFAYPCQPEPTTGVLFKLRGKLGGKAELATTSQTKVDALADLLPRHGENQQGGRSRGGHTAFLLDRLKQTGLDI